MHGIFTYISLKSMANVGKYSSPMEHLGIIIYISYLYFHAEPAEGQTPSPVFACFSPRQQKSMRRSTVKTHWPIALHHFHCNTGALPIVTDGKSQGQPCQKGHLYMGNWGYFMVIFTPIIWSDMGPYL